MSCFCSTIYTASKLNIVANCISEFVPQIGCDTTYDTLTNHLSVCPNAACMGPGFGLSSRSLVSNRYNDFSIPLIPCRLKCRVSLDNHDKTCNTYRIVMKIYQDILHHHRGAIFVCSRGSVFAFISNVETVEKRLWSKPFNVGHAPLLHHVNQQ